ncbi:hypothetical protein [Streptomyces sp. IB201691-2A2]|uniref:hypothetical protein n=1 Tax=Streptomyces sp. IB201691-2A2 TaxID=2561920 RepID=UPI0011803C41|nr:hypothetical protein [Streptomyces sp. IB201691-2A2]TRO55776.1 hypothetical protein E4K73_49225 [Streptomyces sp. IB201691-2A2]
MSSRGDRNEGWWTRLGRFADVLQVLGWLGLPSVAVLALWVLSHDAGDKTPSPPPTSSPSPSVSSLVPTTSDPPSDELTVKFVIKDSYLSDNADSARACPTVNGFCLAAEAVVLEADGNDINIGCRLWWRLYAEGSSKVLEKGFLTYCNKTIFLGYTPMQPGKYRIEGNAEVPSKGTEGKGEYRFRLTPNSDQR